MTWCIMQDLLYEGLYVQCARSRSVCCALTAQAMDDALRLTKYLVSQNASYGTDRGGSVAKVNASLHEPVHKDNGTIRQLASEAR